MIRLLLIIAALFALAAGFEWLKDTPGELALTIGGTVYSVGLAKAALAIVVIAVISVIAYLLFRTVVTAPGRALFAWRGRKVEQGRRALSQGLLAVAAGDVRRAELATREATKKLPNAPLTALLQAQTAQLRGDRDTARDVFTAMIDRRETRIAGLHGLFIEAERQGAAEAAHHYASQAREAQPDTGWAARALQRYQAAAGDWDGALQTLAAATGNRTIDKKTARHLRAVLLTAKAMDGENADTQAAKQAALEAHQLEPELAPAAIVAGRILSRLGEIKRGAKVLETTWKAAPHPEVAEAYAYLRPGDSALDRMERMDRLFKLKPHNDEGRMALAQMAMEATEFDKAREALKPIITTRPTRNALLLMADIDEAEHGDRGRVREWLARAVKAPRDPVWTADGVILDEWAPVSPVTGRIGAVEWKVPVDEGESTLSIDMDDEAFRPRERLPLAAAPAAVAAALSIGADDAEAERDEADSADDDGAVEDAEIIDVTAEAPPAGDRAEPAAAAAAKAAVTPEVKAAPVAAAAEPAAEPEAAAKEAKPAEAPDEAEAAAKAPREPQHGGPSPGEDAAPAAEPSARREKAVPPAGNGEEKSEPAASGVAANDDAPAVTDEDGTDDETDTTDETSPESEEDEPEIIIPHVPDDPGVDDSEEPEPRRFKLF